MLTIILAGHTSTSTSNPVIKAAGRLKIDKSTGKIYHVDGWSGHYVPNPNQEDSIIQKFISEGLY